MISTIKKGMPPKDVKRIYAKGSQKKSTKSVKELKNLCGALSLDKDPLVLQKEWRDEWG